MKDRILASYLGAFVDQFGLGGLNETEAFEYFVNHCVVSKYHPDSFDPESVSVGGGGDLGLDGVAVVVNDHLVFAPEDVDHLKKALRRLDVQFVFVQAKTSAHFDGADIGSFISGVRHFFKSTLPREVNDRVRAAHVLKEHIFDASIDMDRSPVCQVYYATTGVWNDDANLRTRISQGIDDLTKTGLFSTVNFTPVDAEGLKQLYRELHHKIVREIMFDKHTILPQIGGVDEAYIGILPCSEYLKLISNEDDTLNRRLFYDNVRDFQGHNPVNSEMEATIRDTARSDLFALLNNGVTVVARDINKVGARFKLKDYQVVNGCQTSHILFLNRDKLTPNVYLPFKLVVTGDSEVTNQVIHGTNRQTAVLLEAFESLAPFQKKLEELYLALGRGKAEPLYYERRSKQYDNLGIRKERIVTLAGQIKCFIAMFLNEPQSTHRYYGELLSSYRQRLFSEAHSPLPYYISALTLATVERLFTLGSLPRTWKPWKFQLLMVYRLLYEPAELPPLNSKAIDKYCDILLEKLENQSDVIEALRRAGEVLERVRERLGELGQPPERTKAFTTALIEAATKGSQQPAGIVKVNGTVKYFSDVRGYGFISTERGEEVFVHFTDIVGAGYRTLTEGQSVQFALLTTQRGLRAVELEPIP